MQDTKNLKKQIKYYQKFISKAKATKQDYSFQENELKILQKRIQIRNKNKLKSK